jgi:hypothetical protein
MRRILVKMARMSVRLKELLLAVLMLLMPLQGAAATLAGLLCDPAAQMHEMHANGGHERGTPPDGEQHEQNAGVNPVWHPFHGTVLGPVVVISLTPAPRFPSRAFAPDASSHWFVPEQLQRPPLA